MLMLQSSTPLSSSAREGFITSTVDSIIKKLPKITSPDKHFALLAICQRLFVKKFRGVPNSMPGCVTTRVRVL